jgi:hypothetical protein
MRALKRGDSRVKFRVKINSITPIIPKSDLEIVLDKESLFLYLKAGKN